MKFSGGESENKDGIHVKLTEFLAKPSLKHLNLEVFTQLSLSISQRR